MSTQRLLTLAAAFANATGNTERAYAFAAQATTDDDRHRHIADARRSRADASHRQEELRRALRRVAEATMRAVPDCRLPASTWQCGRVEIRAITTDGTRTVRVRYTPAEAVAAGTALIACAAITDTAGGGTLSRILGGGAPEPTTGQDVPEDGRRT